MTVFAATRALRTFSRIFFLSRYIRLMMAGDMIKSQIRPVDTHFTHFFDPSPIRQKTREWEQFLQKRIAKNDDTMISSKVCLRRIESSTLILRKGIIG